MNIKPNKVNLVPCRACGGMAVVDTRNNGIQVEPCDCVMESLSTPIDENQLAPLS